MQETMRDIGILINHGIRIRLFPDLVSVVVLGNNDIGKLLLLCYQLSLALLMGK